MRLLSYIRSDINKNSNKALPTKITDKTQGLQLLKQQQDNEHPNKIRESQKYLFNSVESNSFKRNSKNENKVKARGDGFCEIS